MRRKGGSGEEGYGGWDWGAVIGMYSELKIIMILIKNTCYPCREGLDIHHGSQPSSTPVPGHPMPPPVLPRHQVHTWYTYIHRGKTLIHIK